MASATLRVAAFTLMFGLGLGSSLTAQADSDAPQIGATSWRISGSARPHAADVQRASSSNVYVDPQTGAEVYLPTGETIDEVVTVVAERVPSVASLDTPSTPASTSGGMPWTMLVAVPVALGLLLGSQKLWRGRRGRSPFTATSRRIPRRLAAHGVGL